METARIVLTTCSTKEQAQTIAHSLLGKRLVGCATMLPGAQSLYRWEGKIADEPEVVILLKTTADRIPELEKELHAIHPYREPEFLVIEVEKAGEIYGAWLKGQVTSAP